MAELTDILFGRRKKVEIGIVQFDCSLSETHNSEAEVTDHPVEEGINITDNIKRLPKSLELNGLITNTPVLLSSSPIITDTGPVEDRVQTAYKKLREIQENGELVDVVTTLNEYKNMVITSFSVVRDAENGNVLNSSLSLREVLITTTEKVDAPEPKEKSQNKTTNKGKKVSKAANEKQTEKSRSIARSLFGR